MGSVEVQLVRSKTITYRWWQDDGPISPEHVEALEAAAEERIREMAAEGFGSGELLTSIRITDDDPEDGVDYSGWWEIKRND